MVGDRQAVYGLGSRLLSDREPARGHRPRVASRARRGPGLRGGELAGGNPPTDARRAVLHEGPSEKCESTGAPNRRAGAGRDQPRGRVEAGTGPRSSVRRPQSRDRRLLRPDVAGQVWRALLASVHRNKLLLLRIELDATPPIAVPSRILRWARRANPGGALRDPALPL